MPRSNEAQPFGALAFRLVGDREQQVDLLDAEVSAFELFGKNPAKLFASRYVVRIAFELFDERICQLRRALPIWLRFRTVLRVVQAVAERWQRNSGGALLV